MKDCKKYLAEAIGTMFLVLFGCGVAVATGTRGNAGIVATALSFGFVIVAMSYAIGTVSGCHINPAVSLAMFLTKKMSLKECIMYMVSQFVGAIIGAFEVALFFGGFENLGQNVAQEVLVDAYGNGGALGVALVVEIILTFAFVFAVIGVAKRTENKTSTGVAIGLALTLVHLLGIRLTGTSVNPARSLAPALLNMISGEFAAISQIWIFIVGPLVGAILAAIVYKMIYNKCDDNMNMKEMFGMDD